MRHVHRMKAVWIAIVGMFLYPAIHAVAESIYHWKDPNGVSCYSNTTIPDGASGFSVMRSVWSETSQTEGSGVADDANEGVNEMPAVESSKAVSDSRAAVLKDRIERRQAAIQYIEKLLTTDPNNAGFRRSLYRKKQYLHEDITRLKLLAK